MKRYFPIVSKIVSIVLIQLALVSCASGAKMYYQSFSFDTLREGKIYGQVDIEVLDYSYGDSHQFGLHPSKEEYEMSTYFTNTSINGLMPRGDFLYVKWRVKETGKVYEDKVDLTHRLPQDMTNYGLHFAIFGSQLYIYLFPPEIGYATYSKKTPIPGHRPLIPRGQTLLDVPYAQQHQIYPDNVIQPSLDKK